MMLNHIDGLPIIAFLYFMRRLISLVYVGHISVEIVGFKSV